MRAETTKDKKRHSTVSPQQGCFLGGVGVGGGVVVVVVEVAAEEDTGAPEAGGSYFETR